MHVLSLMAKEMYIVYRSTNKFKKTLSLYIMLLFINYFVELGFIFFLITNRLKINIFYHFVIFTSKLF